MWLVCLLDSQGLHNADAQKLVAVLHVLLIKHEEWFRETGLDVCSRMNDAHVRS